MAEWVIEPLRAGHDRTGFSCGQPPLDNFIRALASQYQKRRLGRTFVATEQGETRVAGFYTLAASSIVASSLPSAERKKLPKHPIPAIHLGRLAVDQSYRGQRLGEVLLFHALRQAREISEKMGVYMVDVWAIDQGACAFYAKYGFLPLEDAPLHLYLAMETVEAMFAP
jgi:GNAT superfamily N-acetyltransferase